LVVDGVAASKGHGVGRRGLLSGYAHFPLDTSEMRVSAQGAVKLYEARRPQVGCCWVLGWGALSGFLGFGSGFFGLLLFSVGGLLGGFGLIEGCLAG